MRIESVAHLAVPTWVWPDGLDKVGQLAPECLLSVLFAYRLPPAWLATPNWQAINLHPGLLPYNAGSHPNVWPLVDGTPAGTTLHIMTDAIDAGPILVQREVPVWGQDTAATLYERLMVSSYDMFVEAWPHVRDLAPRPQPPGGTYHRHKELAALDPSPEEVGLIDRLRARTFAPYGAEFERNGERYRVRVEIERIDGTS